MHLKDNRIIRSNQHHKCEKEDAIFFADCGFFLRKSRWMQK